MSLQGTFDTLPLTEVLGLLSTAGKSGALRLEAGGHEAHVFLSGGRCCAVEADDASGPVASPEALAARLVDVGFSLGRIASGSFRFSDGEAPAFATESTTAVDPAITEIQGLLDQWRDIEATIPSLDVRIRLAPVLVAEEIRLRREEWSVLVDLEAMPTVRDLVRRRPEPMIEVCRILKDLVDRGAAEVGSDLSVPQPRLGRPVRGRDGVIASNPTLEPQAPYAPGIDADAPVPGSARAPMLDAEEALADVVAAVSEARPDSVAVAAGLAGRGRVRRSVPDVFASDLDADADAETDVDADAEPVVAAVAPSAPTAVPAPSAGDDGSTPDRGALLRLFSALKEN